jgi:VIT1/CCC1 family predicted Fe2+/Mn2+ transporter
MILTTLTLQIGLVVIQNAHRGPAAVLKEVLWVLSLCKAGVDALRVARGEGHVAGAPIDPFTEMLMCKVLEMVCESIPGMLLQAIIVLYSGVTTAALLSILLSCLSTAFTATMLAYDVDTNAAKRKTHPEFYGYTRPPG